MDHFHPHSRTDGDHYKGADGQGVGKDYAKAHKWLDLAAARFLASETDYRKTAVRERGRVAAKMTPVQIAEAPRLAREWTPK